MVAMDKKFRPLLTVRQWEAWKALEDPTIDEVMYGGAKGGGKSVFLCYWAYCKAYEIAQKYFKKKPDHPVPVGFIGRKVAKHFKDTTLETWKRFIPSHRYKLKGDPAEIIIDDRVKILTGGLDNREEMEKFNSAEFAFFVIDQAEETEIDDISVLRAALRIVFNGTEKPDYKGLFSANPRQCWLKNEFVTAPTPSRKFIQALPGDNRYLDDRYINRLKDSFKHRPELLEAYLFGSWIAFEGADQVIKEKWLRLAMQRSPDGWASIREYLVCDTARFGDDETVIDHMENTRIVEEIIMPHCKSTEISSRLAVLAMQNGNIPIVVEALGADLGAAVIDELQEYPDLEIIQFNPSAGSLYLDPVSQKPIYYNMRAEAWSESAKILCSGIIDRESNTLVCNDNFSDKLIDQLCTPTYKFKKGKILIEPKADIKKRMGGQSPDRADTYIMALWAWKFITPREDLEPTVYRKHRKGEKPRSAMTC